MAFRDTADVIMRAHINQRKIWNKIQPEDKYKAAAVLSQGLAHA